MFVGWVFLRGLRVRVVWCVVGVLIVIVFGIFVFMVVKKLLVFCFFGFDWGGVW